MPFLTARWSNLILLTYAVPPELLRPRLTPDLELDTRDGKAFRREVDLPNVFHSPNRQEDLVIQNGDVVYVERAPMVYIYGEVQRPGVIRLERDMTVMQALAAGGGLTQRGTERGMRVHRRGADVAGLRESGVGRQVPGLVLSHDGPSGRP